MIRLIYHIPIIIFALIVDVIFILLGWILVPIASLSKAYVMTNGYDGAGNPRPIFHFTWDFMYPWDNVEDGIANSTYWKSSNMFLQIIYWSCIRNPANNLRVMPLMSIKIDPKLVQWIGGPHLDPMLYDLKPPKTEWFYAWQGPYASLWWQYRSIASGKIVRLWIGWSIYPSDVNGVTPYRQNGAGFKIQWKDL